MILSSKQLKKIAQEKIFRFFGGIKPKEMKDTTDSIIEELKIPSLICLPIERHLGGDGELLVNVGDHVKRGQKLTQPNEKSRLVPVHASTSGTVSSISKEILPHPSGYTGLCITIKPDGFDEAVDASPIADWENQDRELLLARIKDFGVEGMGGAQFQT
ncbi:MAG: electron transport complex subunit RsxC, partial [Succinivibrio sp.]